MLPPRASAADYVSFVYKNRKFYGRRGSPLIRWSLVELIPAPELTQGRP
jgi:hypothetical protein